MSNYMTMQEIFDAMTDHLYHQGSAAMDVDGNCFYRIEDSDGTMLKCAIGALIKDEYYDECFENAAVKTLQELHEMLPSDNKEKAIALRKALESSGVDVSNSQIIALLQRVQEVHDDFDISNWDSNLESIANLYGLQYKSGRIYDIYARH